MQWSTQTWSLAVCVAFGWVCVVQGIMGHIRLKTTTSTVETQFKTTQN